jgi:hypothetical protein
MPSDRADPAIWRSAQDRALARYVQRELYPYSPSVRARLDAARLGPRGITGRASLSRLPAVAFDQLGPPADLVLRPDEDTIRRFGEPALAWRVRWARLLNRPRRANRELLDPVYKPVHWHLDDGLPVASSVEDIDRLAEHGRQWLELAGLGPYDTLVGLLPPGPNLAFWQLTLGCREGGLSALHVPPVPEAADVEGWGPSVLAGRPADLLALLEAARAQRRSLAGLHTLLAVGQVLSSDDKARLVEASGRSDLAVVAAWAPRGARALWSECRGGPAFHTWPDAEVVEVVNTAGQPVVRGEGDLVWTALGWKGTALVRVETGERGALDDGRCPRCQRTTPRLRVVPPPPVIAAPRARRTRAPAKKASAARS